MSYKYKEYQKKYREENKEKQRLYNKEWREKNKEKKKQMDKKYREEHKEEYKEYCEANKDKRKEQLKQYRLENKEKLKEYRTQYIEANKEILKQKRNTEIGKMKQKINKWITNYKIKFDDKNEAEFYYKNYINATNCSWCDKKFKNNLDRCMDHCHTCGVPRAIICRGCNNRDEVPCVNCLL
tara:strand:+ start:152 stop:697 length:546 start_codon:yes stop_codon:yes gene_type:complete